MDVVDLEDLNDKLEKERLNVQVLNAKLEQEKQARESMQSELTAIRVMLEKQGRQPGVKQAKMVSK